MTSFIDPLRLAIALGPLAVYFLLLGCINLGRRPFVTTGARDFATLGIAIAGFVIAGPMELFMPSAAAYNGPIRVWTLMLMFYTLSLTLVVLLMRPRIVIYNSSKSEVKKFLVEQISKLDSTAVWAGDSLKAPQLHISVHLETFGALRNVQIVSAGANQSFKGWRRLESLLVTGLRDHAVASNPYGRTLVTMGLLICIALGYYLYNDPQTVAQSLREMLRL